MALRETWRWRERTLTDLSSRIATRRAGVLLDVEGAATWNRLN